MFSPYTYETDPQRIERESFRQIRALSQLDAFSREQQQVLMRIIHSLGVPAIAEQVRFSEQACTRGMWALANNKPVLCDVEMVKQGVTKRMVAPPPLCFLNHPQASLLAQQRGETRSMAALSLWSAHLADSVVLIGNAPTALFRLLEMLADGAPKPAVIIAMPVGFVGAAESKQALWAAHRQLGVECITLLGREGGSALTAAACNALLRCHRGEYY
ncbi:MAG: precorrin-8X methylmutase [Cellvibrionaceae bacterium]|nr:precorrin-8X methylmutase [Cellvibrionaceae bacterium]